MAGRPVIGVVLPPLWRRGHKGQAMPRIPPGAIIKRGDPVAILRNPQGCGREPQDSFALLVAGAGRLDWRRTDELRTSGGPGLALGLLAHPGRRSQPLDVGAGGATPAPRPPVASTRTVPPWHRARGAVVTWPAPGQHGTTRCAAANIAAGAAAYNGPEGRRAYDREAVAAPRSLPLALARRSAPRWREIFPRSGPRAPWPLSAKAAVTADMF
jgi:hypothetical protein